MTEDVAAGQNGWRGRPWVWPSLLVLLLVFPTLGLVATTVSSIAIKRSLEFAPGWHGKPIGILDQRTPFRKRGT